LAPVVQVAGSRGTVARGFAEAQGAGGLEQYAVRSWPGWSRPMPWAMGASARLTVRRAANLPAAALAKKN